MPNTQEQPPWTRYFNNLSDTRIFARSDPNALFALQHFFVTFYAKRKVLSREKRTRGLIAARNGFLRYLNLENNGALAEEQYYKLYQIACWLSSHPGKSAADEARMFFDRVAEWFNSEGHWRQIAISRLPESNRSRRLFSHGPVRRLQNRVGIDTRQSQHLET
jgi:hypothetical protein